MRLRGALLEVFADDAVHHAVDPLALAHVRLALHAFLDPTGAFGVALRPLVEPVDGHLETVVAEVEDEVALEEPRALVGESASAEGRVHGEAAAARDPVPRADAVERERPRGRAVELDDEAAGRVGILVLPLELPDERIAVERLAGSEERTHVFVGERVEEEVEIVLRRPAQGHSAQGS